MDVTAESHLLQFGLHTIVGRIEAKWTDINLPLGSNAVFDIETRVGVTLFYLTHEGSYQVAGSF
ncbi:hypothetical protein PF007_g22007, partial [Phytophthora fragariae]